MPITIQYPGGYDGAELALDKDELLDAIESGLRLPAGEEGVAQPDDAGR